MPELTVEIDRIDPSADGIETARRPRVDDDRERGPRRAIRAGRTIRGGRAGRLLVDDQPLDVDQKAPVADGPDEDRRALLDTDIDRARQPHRDLRMADGRQALDGGRDGRGLERHQVRARGDAGDVPHGRRIGQNRALDAQPLEPEDRRAGEPIDGQTRGEHQQQTAGPGWRQACRAAPDRARPAARVADGTGKGATGHRGRSSGVRRMRGMRAAQRRCARSTARRQTAVKS